MAKKIWIGLLVGFSLTALFFGYIFINRLNYDYNTNGIYLDRASDVVYYEQAISVYGILTAVFLAGAIFSAIKGSYFSKQKSNLPS